MGGAKSRQQVEANLSRFDRRPLVRAGLRPAAVALIVAPGPAGKYCFVLTRRAARLRAHAGQWALPGGRAEAGESSREVALRETHEEVGVRLGGDAVVGELDDFATRSGYCITPVVLWSAARLQLRPDPGEVAAVYEVPVEALGQPGVPTFSRIAQSDRPLISVPLPALGTLVPAPTAAILDQLWEVAFQGRATRVAHYEQPVFAWS